MRKRETDLSNPPEIQFEKYSQTETVLLKWIEIIIALVCGIVLVFTLICSPSTWPITRGYTELIATEIIILSIAIVFFEKNKLTVSSNLLILAGFVGPWWSALIDNTIIQGNLIPLAYTTIPILFSSFFSPVSFTVVIGIAQSLGLIFFFRLGDFDLSHGAASLFFFELFIFSISLIINIQNRNNRQTISKQVEQLKEYAIRDPLTNLHNRRFPSEFLQNEFKKLKKFDGILSIILLDVDNFKYYNDTYGHDCGDQILVSISRLINENFRQSDITCRYGGDEFFIAMSGSDVGEARKKVKILQDRIAEEKYAAICDAEVQVTISIGIAAYPRHGETVDEVIKAADVALYLAKEKGKNCIEVME